MSKKPTGLDQFNWRLPLYATLGALIFFVPVAIGEPDISLIIYLLVIAPIISLCMIVFLVKNAIARKNRCCLSIMLALAIYWTISGVLVANYFAVRSAARWLIWSNDYKLKVLAQPNPSTEELKHIEWDGWGMFGQDTSVFLVFDPADSLLAASTSHKPGKFNGIPCDVYRVRRLEGHWYAVQFYTDEQWGQCD